MAIAVSTTFPDAPRRPDSVEASALKPFSRRKSLSRLFTVNISALEHNGIIRTEKIVNACKIPPDEINTY